VMHLGRRFALGDLRLRFGRTVGRTSGLNVVWRAWRRRASAATRGSRMNRLANMVRELGPYTAIALILPGGSLIALAAWALRHRALATAHLGRLLVMVVAFGAALILPGN
jgi:hypothetical protein